MNVVEILMTIQRTITLIRDRLRMPIGDCLYPQPSDVQTVCFPKIGATAINPPSYAYQ